MNKDRLIIYQRIYQQLIDITPRADDKIRGQINLDQNVLDDLVSLLACNLIDEQVYLNAHEVVNLGDLNHNHIGQVARVQLDGLRPHGQFFIGPNWSKLLSYPKKLVDPPHFIYLYDSNLLFDETSTNLEYLNLHKIAWVLKQLHDNADYKSDLECVFLHHQKVDIALKYNADILSHSIEIDSLKILIEDEHHKSAKTSIFKAVVCEMLADTKKEKRLDKLISEFNVFATRFELAFHSYVSDYSFDKIRKQFEEKRTEYIKKVNDVFHDIASKLIILPAPLWLAINQSKAIREDGVLNLIQLYKNAAIGIITISVAVILGVMIYGQFKVLESVQLEYTNLFKRLQNEFPDVKLNSQNELKSLSNRHNVVYCQLISAQIINVLMFVFSCVVIYQAF